MTGPREYHRDHTYSRQPTSCQFSARFYDYSCLGVAEETFTRHKRPASQICSPPVVVSDNSFHSSLFLLPFLFVRSLKPFRDRLPTSNNTRNPRISPDLRIFAIRSVSKSIKHHLFFITSLVPVTCGCVYC